MNTEPLFRELRQAQAHLETLYQRGLNTELPQATRAAYDGLFLALETLQVAEAEMRQQDEAILATQEIAMRERQNFEELFNFAPDAYFVTNELGIIQQANHTASLLLGIKSRYLLGKPLSVYIAEAERRAFRIQLHRLTRLAPREVQQWELTVQGRHAALPLAVAASVMLVLNAAGEMVGYRWLLRDITRRKQAETAQLETNQKLTALVAASPLGIVMLDQEERVQLWNRAAEEMLGWTEAEVIGHALPNIPDGYELEFESNFAAMMRNELPFVQETVRKRKDGTLVPVLLSIAPLRGADGGITGVVALLMDRTEQQQAQAELGVVKAQLATAQEVERHHLARELHDGVIQQLLALQMRLTAQRRFISTNKETEQESVESLHSLLATFEAELGGMLQLLRGVISTLRPAGLEEYGLTVALDGYIGQLQREWPDSTATIQARLSPSPIAVPLPVATCLFRVAQEALRNALRHARAQTIEVRLTYSDAQATLSVYDDGQGFTVPPRLTQLARAGHFGLVGIMERVELLGGILAIDSDPREGTTISVELPLRVEIEVMQG